MIDNINERKIDLYKETYYYELGRKDTIFDRIKFNVSLLIISISVILYYFNSFPKTLLQDTISFLIFIFLVLSSFILSAISMVKIFNALYNYSYKYLPTSIEIENHLKNRNDRDTVIEFDAMITENIIECSTHNAVTNDTKIKELNWSLKFVIASFFVHVLSFIIFVTAKLNEPENILIKFIHKIIGE
jgi:hypothetical protein